MKKVLLVILLLAVAIGGLTLMKSRDSKQTGDAAVASNEGAKSVNQDLKLADDLDAPGDDDIEFDDRPAAQVYASADEAYEDILKGAEDYDDIVLERFTQPGPECQWCDALYARITEKLADPDLNEDELTYLGEVLAISGRVENIQTLVQGVIEGGDTEKADIYAESLELTLGDDKVVEFLKGYIESSNELLQESVVAAVTNQGSPFAAETLYEHTIAHSDPDGYYSLGIGLGEFIPDQEAMPYLMELAKKRDEYSHLAVKAMLNEGPNGLQSVLEILSTSEGADAEKNLLQDAIDHIMYDEESIALLRNCSEKSQSATAKQFCSTTLQELADEEAELAELEDELGEDF